MAKESITKAELRQKKLREKDGICGRYERKQKRQDEDYEPGKPTKPRKKGDSYGKIEYNPNFHVDQLPERLEPLKKIIADREYSKLYWFKRKYAKHIKGDVEGEDDSKLTKKYEDRKKKMRQTSKKARGTAKKEREELKQLRDEVSTLRSNKKVREEAIAQLRDKLYTSQL